MRACARQCAHPIETPMTRMTRSPTIAALLFVTAALVATGAGAAPLAYVPNEGSASVSVIDTATDKVVATLKFGQKPRGIAISLDGTRLYLSDQTANALVVVDTAARAEIARVAARRFARGHLPVARRQVDRRGDRGKRPGRDRRHGRRSRSPHGIKMRGKNPEHAVWSPDGRWLYVSAEEADSVDIVDVARREVVKSVKVGDRPRGIGFLPDGTRAYVAAENADTVNVFDVAKQEVIARIKAGEPLQRRHRPPGRQARLRNLRRRGHRAGDRHRDQHHRARNPRRASGRGTWRSRPTARSSTSPAAARTRSPSSIPPPTRRSRRSPSAICRGVSRSADRTRAMRRAVLAPRGGSGVCRRCGAGAARRPDSRRRGRRRRRRFPGSVRRSRMSRATCRSSPAASIARQRPANIAEFLEPNAEQRQRQRRHRATRSSPT